MHQLWGNQSRHIVKRKIKVKTATHAPFHLNHHWHGRPCKEPSRLTVAAAMKKLSELFSSHICPKKRHTKASKNLTIKEAMRAADTAQLQHTEIFSGGCKLYRPNLQLLTLDYSTAESKPPSTCFKSTTYTMLEPSPSKEYTPQSPLTGRFFSKTSFHYKHDDSHNLQTVVFKRQRPRANLCNARFTDSNQLIWFI